MDLEIKAMVKELCTQCQNPDNQRQLHDHYTHGNGQQNHGACYLCEIVPFRTVYFTKSYTCFEEDVCRPCYVA